MSKKTTPKIKPFMPYMGGKTKLLPVLLENMPTSYNNYHEPFLGGGALALDEMSNRGVTGRKYYLSDYSHDVIDAWTAVKDCPHELAGYIETMMANHCKTSFMAIRSWDKDGLLAGKSVAERGARFIYLMLNSFGSKIKTNTDGFLLVSYAWRGNVDGSLRNYDFDNMFAVSALLNSLDVTISHASYEAVLDNAGYGDFIYLDPPYDPQSDTGAILSSDYLADPVSQQSVRKNIDTLTSMGCMTLMSNSDTAGIREIYDGWACSRPQVYWTSGEQNKLGEELLVSNWRLADNLHRNLALAS